MKSPCPFPILSSVRRILALGSILFFADLAINLEMGWCGTGRFQFSTQIGVTQADYSEPALGASSSQKGLHFKQGATYNLIQNRIDFSLVGYISGLGNLISSRQTLETGTPEIAGGPTYWGVSARFPISVAPKSSRWDFRIAPGYSTWGMLVDEEAYGISLLATPMVHLSFRNRKNGTRPWGLSFKLSPLSSELNAVIDNRELAAGFDFQLSSLRAKRPLIFHLDYATTSFDLPTGSGSETRAGTFESVSCGLAIRW